MTPSSNPPSRSEILIVAGAFFLEVLDATIMTPALLVMADAMQTSVSAVTISLAAYVFALVLFTPLAGRLWPGSGWKAQFLLGLCIVFAGSAVCALAQSLDQLVVGRLVQGLGSATLVPAGRSIVLSRTSKADLPVTMAWLIWPALLAPVFGLAVGGHLVQAAGWRAIFWIMMAIAIALFLCGWRVFGAQRVHALQGGFDAASYGWWAGFSSLLFGAFIAVIVKSTALAVLLSAGAAFALLCMRGTLAARDEHALFSIDMLRVATFRLNVGSGSLFRVAIYAFPIILSIDLMQTAHYTPSAVGNCLVFIFVGNLAGKPIAAAVLRGLRQRRAFFVLSAAATSLSLALFLLPGIYASPGLVSALCVLHGVARSFQFLGYSATAFQDVAAGDVPRANIFTASVMQVNALLGQALGAILALWSTSTVMNGQENPWFLAVGVSAVLALSLTTVVTAMFIPRYPQSMEVHSCRA